MIPRPKIPHCEMGPWYTTIHLIVSIIRCLIAFCKKKEKAEMKEKYPCCVAHLCLKAAEERLEEELRSASLGGINT